MEANKDLLKETITDKPCTGWKHTSVCRHGKGIALRITKNDAAAVAAPFFL